MKLHYLRYFCVLAEELHFHRAADRLAISQPPLSAAIKALEEELGAQLLRRNSKMVELTAAGAAFLVEAREILERVNRAGDIVRASEEGVRGRIDLGISGSLLYREVPKVLERFQSALPTVDVVMHELSSAEQVEKIGRRQLDAGFLHASHVASPLASLPLASDQYVLCLPERHPLAARKSVDLRNFAGERFVMFSREAAPSNHDNVIDLQQRRDSPAHRAPGAHLDDDRRHGRASGWCGAGAPFAVARPDRWCPLRALQRRAERGACHAGLEPGRHVQGARSVPGVRQRGCRCAGNSRPPRCYGSGDRQDCALAVKVRTPAVVWSDNLLL
jgi:DNA-binding transcriptional LysR family regulator